MFFKRSSFPFLAAGLLLLLVSQANAVKLGHKYSSFSQKLNLPTQQYSIAKISVIPGQVLPNEPFNFAIELSNDFTGSVDIEPVVVATLNGSSVKVYHRGGRLWTTESKTIAADGTAQISVSLFVQNKQQSAVVLDQLAEVDSEIDSLSRQILLENDPAKKAHLISQREQKILFKQDLQTSLDGLKRSVASKTLTFQVGQSSVPTDYPRLDGCTPAFGDVAGNIPVTVNGLNLNGVSKVTIGGVEIPTGNYTVTSNTIEFLTPAMGMGLKDVVVESNYGGSVKTITLKNAYFALEQATGPIGPVYPVAFAGTPKVTPADVAVALDGSSSYSPDEAPLTYLWSVVSRPDGALATDGQFDDSTLMSPMFTASTPGAFVVSLVVSNGVKSSVPSLTVVTIGPKDPVTLTPTNILGSVGKDGVYVGAFKACNNLQQEMRYQLFNANRIVLISGFKKGVLGIGACQVFQFSVVNYSATTISFDIPFVVQTPVAFTKNVHMEISPATVSGLSLLASFPVSQWGGERDLEVLSSTGYVPLFGTYDESSTTALVLKNSTSTDITITDAPTIQHLNGSSGVFSIDFPVGGLIVPANGDVSIDVVVSPGTFGSDDRAEALLQWNVGDGGAPRSLLLQSYKLKAPVAATKLVDFGQVEEGDFVFSKYLRVPSDFLGEVFGFSEISSLTVTDNANGDFSLDLYGWPGTMIVGDIDYIRMTGFDAKAEFSSVAVGTYSATVKVKVKGYQGLFEYTCNLEIIPEVTP
ncbi:IPT/TIG domain-containing protein [Bdellovibrio bacteriovorus]|uniref:IPT/TIG domain-containing protein n=1 Tax=Bdellovibrio bacteriovorus TaxID=959 RepID=UPI003A805B35